LRAYRADFINSRVEELTGDRPLSKLDVSQEELRELPDQYKRRRRLQHRGCRRTASPAAQ